MAVFSGPKITDDGLSFSLDVSNIKSKGVFPSVRNHCAGEWIAMRTQSNVQWSTIYKDVKIIEVDTDGTETIIHRTSRTSHEAGTIGITAGKRYYGTKAIHILSSGVNDALAPVSFAGTYFGNIHTRSNPKTMNIYAPQDDINVSVYEDVTGGVTGTATSTFSVSRGSSATFVTTQGINVYTIFETDKPAIMTVGSGSDDHVMMPMTNYVYKRRNHYSRTINNTAPANVGTYVSHDTSGSNLPLFALEIADGSGSDSAQGIGYEYLSDTFSWGNALSDYQIVAPYADTTVTVSYWLNNQWNVGEVHSLSGTQTSPDAVDRDGTNGFGVDGSDISGNASFLVSGSATLWKWESTKPIAVIINDTTNDEENLLGWMSNNHLRTSSNSTQSFVNLIDKDDRSRMKMYGKDLTTTVEYAGAKLSAGDIITFDGVDDHIIINDNFNDPQQFTIEFWAYPTQLNFDSNNNYRRIFIPSGASTNDDHSVLIEQSGYISFRVPGGTTNNMQGSGYSGTNEWGYVVCTYDQSNKKIYFNGSLKNTTAESGVTVDFGSPQIVDPNSQTFKGNISNFRIYNRALTASEIQQNFNALKGRFGI